LKRKWCQDEGFGKGGGFFHGHETLTQARVLEEGRS